jgi:hypothetical protein
MKRHIPLLLAILAPGVHDRPLSAQSRDGSAERIAQGGGRAAIVPSHQGKARLADAARRADAALQGAGRQHRGDRQLSNRVGAWVRSAGNGRDEPDHDGNAFSGGVDQQAVIFSGGNLDTKVLERILGGAL